MWVSCQARKGRYQTLPPLLALASATFEKSKWSLPEFINGKDTHSCARRSTTQDVYRGIIAGATGNNLKAYLWNSMQPSRRGKDMCLCLWIN